MQFSERELEDWFFENPQFFAHSIRINPFTFEWIGRQVQVPSGIIDLLGCSISDGHAALHVVELKADAIKTNAIGQAVRYAHDIKLVIKSPLFETKWEVYRHCVGTSINDTSVLFEAEACGVNLFVAKPMFHMTGPMVRTDALRKTDDTQRDSIAQKLVKQLTEFREAYEYDDDSSEASEPDQLNVEDSEHDR